jgi:hypothetical protein
VWESDRDIQRRVLLSRRRKQISHIAAASAPESAYRQIISLFPLQWLFYSTQNWESAFLSDSIHGVPIERVAGLKNGCCDRALFDMLVGLISLFRFFKDPLSIDTFLKHVHPYLIFKPACESKSVH